MIIYHLDKLRNEFIDLLRLKNGHFLDEIVIFHSGVQQIVG